jgi:hypothetical protein
LSETRVADRTGNFNNVYKGYVNTQHSSSGEVAKGVMIFTKRGTQCMEGSVYNNNEGYYTTAVYRVLE